MTMAVGLIVLMISLVLMLIFGVACDEIYPPPWTAKAKDICGWGMALGAVIAFWPLVAVCLVFAVIIFVPGLLLRKLHEFRK